MVKKVSGYINVRALGWYNFEFCVAEICYSKKGTYC